MPSLKDMVKLYEDDLEARGRAESTRAKYLRTLNVYLGELPKGSDLTDITVEHLTRWRIHRKVAPSTARTEIENISFFLKWCVRRKWIAENPAAQLEKPEEDDSVTLPFDDDEVKNILAGVDKVDNNNREWAEFGRRRGLALVLILLYSGLRISDVAVLGRKKIDRKTRYLTLRQEKKDQGSGAGATAPRGPGRTGPASSGTPRLLLLGWSQQPGHPTWSAPASLGYDRRTCRRR